MHLCIRSFTHYGNRKAYCIYALARSRITEIGVAYRIYAFVHSRIAEIGTAHRIYAFTHVVIGKLIYAFTQGDNIIGLDRKLRFAFSDKEICESAYKSRNHR